MHSIRCGYPFTVTSTVLRRLAISAAVAAALTVTSLTWAGPAGATTPEHWEKSDPVSAVHVLLLLGGIPLLLFVLIGVAVYLPSIARGEAVTPGPAMTGDAWLGGPRRAAAELADPDDAGSKAGGAGTTW